MAMGGSYKGNGGSSVGHRGRPYGLMLLLAFGAALLGVMVLHKLRERRIFNLLVKEKDRDLISLQLLLQKEIDLSKEMKRKNEEMKAKIYSLRTQKMELDRRILEKQSTIGSLKDEQKAMESALKEKQNEIKMLRVKEIDPGKENPQVIALMESLNQKDAEIEDLKHRLEYPVKVWSVSTNDPSSPPVNSTMNSAEEAKIDVFNSAEEGNKLHESRNHRGDDNLTASEDRSKLEPNSFRESETKERVEDGNGNLVGDSGRREMIGEQMQKQGKLQDESNNYGGQVIDKPIEDGLGGKNEDSQDGGGDFEGRRDKDIEVTEKLQNSQEHDNREPREINKGGMKSEESDNSGIITRMRGKHGHVSKTKAKRWRMLVRNRHNGHLVNNDAVSMRSRRFFRGDQDGELKGRTEEAEREGGEMGVYNPVEESKAVNVSGTKLLKHQNPDTNHQREMLENAQNSYNEEVQVLSSNGETSNDTDDARKQKVEEARRAEESEASGIQQQTSSGDLSEVDDNSKQVRVGNTNTVPEDLEDANEQESHIVAADGDFFKESKSDTEGEDQYKEETDESEF